MSLRTFGSERNLEGVTFNLLNEELPYWRHKRCYGYIWHGHWLLRGSVLTGHVIKSQGNIRSGPSILGSSITSSATMLLMEMWS
jgi:hypothetical protein